MNKEAQKVITGSRVTPLETTDEYYQGYGNTVTTINDSEWGRLKRGEVFYIDDGEYTHMILHEGFKEVYDLE